MEKLKTFSIDIDRRSVNGEPTDLRVWLRFEAPAMMPGLSWMSFLMLGDEWRDLFDRKRSHFVDGMHHLNVLDESWTFFDLDVPHRDSGTMSLGYTRITMPHRVRETILKRIEDGITRYDNDERTERWPLVLDFSGELEHWSTNYGRGTGTIEIVADSETRDQLGSLRGEKTFDHCWATLERLALGSTLSSTDVAPIKISRDGSGFFWNAGRMHGGIINHGTEQEPNWSVHT